MSVYNPSDPESFSRMESFIRYARECGFLVELHKHHPAGTPSQLRYIHFMLSYWAMKNGETFFATLAMLRTEICPMAFLTDRVDRHGRPSFRPLSALSTAQASSVIRNFLDFASVNGCPIPSPDDTKGIRECTAEIETSGAGWI